MNMLIKYYGFVEAVKAGSISAAAENLHYSQSGVSHMISSLEEEFGFPLFNRAKSGVELTPEGQHIFELCEKLLETQDQINGTIEQIKGSVIGTIRIGAYYSVITNWFPRILEEVNKRYPKLEVQIVEGTAGDLFNKMQHNTIDAGILSSFIPEDFTFTPLHNDPAVVIVPKDHPLTKLDRVEISDLLPYPFMIKPEDTRGIMEEVLQSQPINISGSYFVHSDNSMQYLIGKGFGISIAGEMVATSSPFVDYRPFAKDYHRTIGIAVPNWKPQTTALRSFLEIVRELYQDEQYITVPTKK